MNKELSEAYQKFHKGDGITDEELSLLINKLSLMIDLLENFGPDHTLSLRALRLDLTVLKEFDFWRHKHV